MKNMARRTITRRVPCSTCKGLGYREYNGDNLRFRRKNAGLGLRELARRGKVTAAYLCDVELNRRAESDRVRAIYDRWCK